MIIKGDVNGDGKISASDLYLLQLHLLEKNRLTGDNLVAADVNNDGNISILDLAKLQLHLIGKQIIYEVVE